MDAVLRFPDKLEMGTLDIRPLPLTGKLVQLQPLHSTHIGDLEEAAKDRSIFELFVDGWIVLRYGITTYVFKLLEEQAKKQTTVPFAVYHQRLRRVIGVTRFYNLKRQDRTVDIASWYASDFHRSGINTEAKYLLLRHAFDHHPCNRVGFHIDVRNTASIEAVERIGAVSEGPRRNDLILANGHSRTSASYSIIRSDWDGNVRNLLERLLDKEYGRPDFSEAGA